MDFVCSLWPENGGGCQRACGKLSDANQLYLSASTLETVHVRRRGHVCRLPSVTWCNAPLLLASPQAAPRSDHGYDVVDPTRVNEDVGGEVALRRLVAALHEQELGLSLRCTNRSLACWWTS